MARIHAIAKFTYRWGMVVAVVAVVYRLLSATALGEAVYRATTIQPRNCLQLSILLLLMSIASEAYASAVAKTQ
ncbi:MAG: hypothetical protein ACRD2Y_01755 [Terriglobales bacterium]